MAHSVTEAPIRHDGPGAGGNDYNDVDSGTLGYVGLVSVILLILTVIAVQTIFYNYVNFGEAEKIGASGKVYDAVVGAEQTQLTSSDFQWVDADKGKVRIPLNLAMEKVLAELQKPSAAGAAVPPLPVPPAPLPAADKPAAAAEATKEPAPAAGNKNDASK